MFCGLALDAQHGIIALQQLFRGTVTQTSVYPREVAKEAPAECDNQWAVARLLSRTGRLGACAPGPASIGIRIRRFRSFVMPMRSALVQLAEGGANDRLESLCGEPLLLATETCQRTLGATALSGSQKEIAMKRLTAFAVAVLATIGSGAAQARTNWSIGIDIAPPVFYSPVPVYVPSPAYAPVPVYEEPRLIYRAPRPVYQPPPVYYYPPQYYQGPTVIYGPPVYERPGWYGHRREHHHEWDDDRYEHRRYRD